MRPCLCAMPGETQAIIWPWEDAGRRPHGGALRGQGEGAGGLGCQQITLGQLLWSQGPLPPLGALQFWLSFILQKKASPAFFSPLLTVNSEYWLVEFRNFPLDHWSEVLFQLVVVLLKFLLILPLICCDETLVFLYGFPTSEMQISGGEKRRLYFIEILYI